MSANIELVTSHQGSPHITTDQVRDLIAGLSGDIDGVKVFSNLDDALEYDFDDNMTIIVKEGQALAAGYHFQLLEPYYWVLDPGVVGYSRIDSLYLVIYEDPITIVQSADFVYQVGTLYQNGTAGTVPDPPTGTNIKETFEIYRVTTSDNAIVVVTPQYTYYRSNEDLENTITENLDQVQKNKEALDILRFGVDSKGNYGYKKVGADTVIPFRNPQGTAGQPDVLESKTFSSKTLENVSGTMKDYSGEHIVVTPSRGDEIEALNLSPGKYNIIYVDKKNPYDSGVVAGQSETWTDTFPMGVPDYFDCANIQRMDLINGGIPPLILTFYNKAGTSIGTQSIVDEEEVRFPDAARYVSISGTVYSIMVIYQTKIIRGQ